MDTLKLVFPDAAYASEIAAYRQEFLDANDSMDGCGPLERFADPLAWIAETERYLKPETTPEGRVPATQFLTIRAADDKLVGLIQVRHPLNDYLAQFGGHIGYSVRPSERRKGYAKEQLRLILPYCKEQLGIDRLLITCDDWNAGSRRTILGNGGVYENTVLEPDSQERLERYWIDLSKEA